MKKQYERTEVRLIEIDVTDVIVTSQVPTPDENEMPII